MGKRGPAPLPTPIKLLRGEKRPQRLNPDAPKPVAGLPVPPEDMDARAREVWDRQIRSMGATGVLTAVDGDALRAYCEAVSRYEEAAKLLAGSGPLVTGARTGELVKNPLHQVARDNAMLLRLLARDLGFVPSGREGIHPGDPGEEIDDLDRWLASGERG